MVNQLIREYRDQPVILVEHNARLDNGNRKRRWYDARNAPPEQGATTPLVMVDSGYRFTEGSVDFRAIYKSFIEDARAVPPLLAIEATQEQIGAGDDLRVFGRITNISEETISYDNSPTLNVITYEEKQILFVEHSAHKVVSVELEDDLPPGASWAFDVAVNDLGWVSMAKMRAVVLVDQKATDGGAGYRSLQAALAYVPPPPTNTPRPPTVTPEPTTEPPPSWSVLLPALKREG